VFVGVNGRRGQVFTVSRDGSKQRQLTSDAPAKRDPVFIGSGKRVQYLERVNGTWRLMEIEADGGTPRAVPGGERWITLRAAPDGTIFGRREGDELVRRVHTAHGPGSGEPLDLGPQSQARITDIDSWTVGADGIYVRRGRRIAEASSVWFFPWQGPGAKLGYVPLASGNIAVDKQGNVLLSQTTNGEVDLAMMELQRQE
jgi:hypothetical protein